MNKILTIIRDGNMAWCPTIDCESQIERVKGTRMSTCDSCKVTFCYKCKRKWHGNDPCRADSIKFENILDIDKKRYKRCPNCAAPIEKIEGCNHITCN